VILRASGLFFLLSVMWYATTAFAADSGYPERPVRVIVTFPPGGGTV
jgi:tripartite-type tricarboxylate transporter receptor subunit TctC